MKKFTLLELLIVIAIIGVLLTLLVPSLERARQKARIAVCLSNHRQIATAYHLYASKNNNIAVSHTNESNFIGGLSKGEIRKGRKRLLNEYVSSSEIAECPSDKGYKEYNRRGKLKGEDSLFSKKGNSYYASYWGAFSEKSTRAGGQHPVGYSTSLPNLNIKTFVSRFEHPDKKIMFYNKNIRHSNDLWWLYPELRKNHSWHSMRELIYPNSFIDGSAKVVNFYMKKIRTKILPKYGRQLRDSGITFAEAIINDFDWY